MKSTGDSRVRNEKPLLEHVAAATVAIARWSSQGKPWDRFEPKVYWETLRDEYRGHSEKNGIAMVHPDILRHDQLAGCMSRGQVISYDDRCAENAAMIFLRVDGLLEAVSESSPNPLSGEQAKYLLRHAMRRSRHPISPRQIIPTLLTGAEAARQATEIARYVSGATTQPITVAGAHRKWEDWEVSRLVKGLEYRRIRREARRFLKLLDPSVLGAMAVTATDSISHYNIYADPRFGRNRCQAAMVFPLMMPAILDTPELLKVVDGGGQLMSALADTLGAPVPLVRRLRGVPMRFIPLVEYGRSPSLAELRQLVQTLSDLPLDHVPIKRRDWVSFLALRQASGAHVLNAAFRRPPQPLYLGVKGRWAETADAIVATVGERAPPYGRPLERIATVTRVIKDANELVSIAYRSFVYPLAVRVIMERAGLTPDDARLRVTGSERAGELTVLASELVYNGLSPAAIVRKSIECHGLPMLFGSLTGPSNWYPLLPETVTAPNGVRIVPLVTAEQLAEEGKTMSHCVAGYASQCAFGGHHILSLRSADDKPLSTAEIGKVMPKAALTVLQHRGVHNHPPPPTADYALGWLLNAVKGGTITLEVSKIEKLLAIRLAERHAPVTPAAMIEAFTVWRPKLTRPWSTLTAEQFVEGIRRRVLQSGVAGQ